MDKRSLKKLRRTELLEMLLDVTRENEQLTAEIADLREQLNQRRIMMDRAGSIAEASMLLSGVFQSAQEAADLYLSNIKAMAREASAWDMPDLEPTEPTAEVPQEADDVLDGLEELLEPND